jgi:hypothetical protein
MDTTHVPRLINSHAAQAIQSCICFDPTDNELIRATTSLEIEACFELHAPDPIDLMLPRFSPWQDLVAAHQLAQNR